LAAKKIGVEPARCLVFEDTIIGKQAANKAMMDSVLVVDGKPDWNTYAPYSSNL
jgi:beta-phosphoglucomutase-like phosphatase (HAD superfamily)